MNIVYIGHKPIKADNVAKTGLTWTRGEIHEVADENAAAKLLEHTKVWADADKDYKLLAEPVENHVEPEPRVQLLPQGGTHVSPFWEPITIVVTNEIFKSLQDKELEAVFMKPEDATSFLRWKEEQKQKEFDPSKLDRRSKAFKEWAAEHPEEAEKLKHAA